MRGLIRRFPSIKSIKKQFHKKDAQINQAPKEWKSEWTWNEKTKLWEHPLSKKAENPIKHDQNNNKTEQNFKVEDNQQVNFKLVIPDNIQELIDEAKKQKLKNQTTIQSETKPRTENTFTYSNTVHTAKPKQAKETKNSQFQNAYEATPILTQNEYRNYKTLNDAATQKGYIVWSKVRLADIVKPRNDSQYMSRFGKIKSKHVDFVILDPNMQIRAIIELDDNSHDRQDRKDRDNFVDTILQDCGFKVIHTRHITSDILNGI